MTRPTLPPSTGQPPIPARVRWAAAELLIGAVTGDPDRHQAGLERLLGPALDPLQTLEQADALLSVATLARAVIATLAEQLAGDPAHAQLLAADLLAAATEYAIRYDQGRRVTPGGSGEGRRQ